jgi:hypothetical protein
LIFSVQAQNISINRRIINWITLSKVVANIAVVIVGEVKCQQLGAGINGKVI